MSDEIFLRELEVSTIIGIFDWERERKQTVSIDLRMPGDIRRAATSDHIDDTLDYKSVAKRVIAHIEASSYQLVETLAESIATIGLEEFGLDWIEVRVNKPGAIRGARDVGVRIRRGMSATRGGHDVYVSLGSNIEPVTHLNRALALLAEHFGPVRRSAVYRNRAVGFEGDDFLNLVAGFRTDETPRTVSDVLADIEAKCGRTRGEAKFAPRTLDLDLLLYGDAVVSAGGIEVPRREIHEYAFMLKPLAELAGHRRDPVSGRAWADIWRDAGLDGHAMTPVAID